MRRKRRQSDHSHKGMAMLVVLFIVAAIAVVASGFIARSDAQLQSGYNYTLHAEADYLAWSGLEHARALVVSPDNMTALPGWSGAGIQLDATTGAYYDLTIDAPVETFAADPNDPSTYTYSVLSSAYLIDGGTVRARSKLGGQLFYDPNSSDCYFLSVTRP